LKCLLAFMIASISSTPQLMTLTSEEV
jgi:hypothetical protein